MPLDGQVLAEPSQLARALESSSDHIRRFVGLSYGQVNWGAVVIDDQPALALDFPRTRNKSRDMKAAINIVEQLEGAGVRGAQARVDPYGGRVYVAIVGESNYASMDPERIAQKFIAINHIDDFIRPLGELLHPSPVIDRGPDPLANTGNTIGEQQVAKALRESFTARIMWVDSRRGSDGKIEYVVDIPNDMPSSDFDRIGIRVDPFDRTELNNMSSRIVIPSDALSPAIQIAIAEQVVLQHLQKALGPEFVHDIATEQGVTGILQHVVTVPTTLRGNDLDRAGIDSRRVGGQSISPFMDRIIIPQDILPRGLLESHGIIVQHSKGPVPLSRSFDNRIGETALLDTMRREYGAEVKSVVSQLGADGKPVYYVNVPDSFPRGDLKRVGIPNGKTLHRDNIEGERSLITIPTDMLSPELKDVIAEAVISTHLRGRFGHEAIQNVSTTSDRDGLAEYQVLMRRGAQPSDFAKLGYKSDRLRGHRVTECLSRITIPADSVPQGLLEPYGISAPQFDPDATIIQTGPTVPVFRARAPDTPKAGPHLK